MCEMATQRTTDKLTPAGIKLDKQFKILKNKPHVKVGILQKHFDDPKEGDPKREFTLGEIAVVNEFGSANGRVPERSFIRSTFDAEKRKWGTLTGKLKQRMIAAQKTIEWILGNMGTKIVGDIQAKINAVKEPPNAPSTIAKKTRAGKVGDNPLVDYGQLKSSITYKTYGTH